MALMLRGVACSEKCGTTVKHPLLLTFVGITIFIVIITVIAIILVVTIPMIISKNSSMPAGAEERY